MKLSSIVRRLSPLLVAALWLGGLILVAEALDIGFTERKHDMAVFIAAIAVYTLAVAPIFVPMALLARHLRRGRALRKAEREQRVKAGMEALTWRTPTDLWQVYLRSESARLRGNALWQLTLFAFIPACAGAFVAHLTGLDALPAISGATAFAGALAVLSVVRERHADLFAGRNPSQEVQLTSTGLLTGATAMLWRDVRRVRFEPGVPGSLLVTIGRGLNRETVRLPVPVVVQADLRELVEMLVERRRAVPATVVAPRDAFSPAPPATSL